MAARVCSQCGDACVDEDTTQQIEDIAEAAQHTGVQVQDYGAT